MLPRITIENLLDTYFSFPDDIRKISPSLHIALSVVNYFLGEDWLEKNLNPLVLKPGFLRLRLDAANETYIQTYKTIDLAELLFNLQHVVGFFRRMLRPRTKTEQYVESGLAELDFGRMLRINNQKFCFITPKGARGDDYDFEITLGRTFFLELAQRLDPQGFSESRRGCYWVQQTISSARVEVSLRLEVSLSSMQSERPDPGMAVPSYGHIGRRACVRCFLYINALRRCGESNKKKVRPREMGCLRRCQV